MYKALVYPGYLHWLHNYAILSAFCIIICEQYFPDLIWMNGIYRAQY